MLVGFVGYIGSGKGSAGEILQNIGFQPISFANKLKDAVSVMFGWPRELLEGNTAASRDFREQEDSYWTKALGKKITPRLALQWMGTEAGRNVFGRDVWVAALLKDLGPNRDYVLTDVRFPNEIEMVTAQGGLLAEIHRYDRPAWYNLAVATNQSHDFDGSVQVLPEYPDVHYSEWAWAGHPLIKHGISNNGTLTELKTTIFNLIGVHR